LTCFVFLCWRDVTSRRLHGCPVSPHARAHDLLLHARRPLYSNAFTGSLPSSVASLTKLTYGLDLHANAAPIAVPGSVCAQHYNHLSLSGVELACPWPTVSECAGNDISKLSGVLLPWRACTSRTLDSCHSTLAPCSTLWSLSLSSKSLSGTVPAWLGSFHGLQMLYVPSLCSRTCGATLACLSYCAGMFNPPTGAGLPSLCSHARPRSCARAGACTPTSCRARCPARSGR
jgi:hypothetical protein